ncbi:hypothetical protein GE061_020267 [Apolygus lucorum]|uniref:C2H2-type domain-containing protein n=1 Tax=Apolygus lucorum TaxID=248454 RepID=A0A8S9WJQ0_APOLU|nr:hypothetical protein GE061_020267 [Apolygus lucorum]
MDFIQDPKKDFFVRHVKSVGEMVHQNFVCPSCHRSYKYYRNLAAHQKLECGVERQFPCPHCPYKAAHKNHLKSHIICSSRDVDGRHVCLACNHINEKFVCYTCFKMYKRRQHLNRHQRLECGKEPTFVCPHCSYKGLNKKFVCHTCFKMYKHRHHLNRHQRLECGKEPNFACPHCPYRAHQKGTLKSHMAIKHLQLM